MEIMCPEVAGLLFRLTPTLFPGRVGVCPLMPETSNDIGNFLIWHIPSLAALFLPIIIIYYSKNGQTIDIIQVDDRKVSLIALYLTGESQSC